MTNPERSRNLSLEHQHPPEGQRISVAYHPYFSKYHHDFYRRIVNLAATDENNQTIPGRRLPIGHTDRFSDNSPLYAALERDSNFRSDCVIAPMWLAPPFPEAMWSIFEVGNAFTQSRHSNEQTLTDRLIAVLPYAELREDVNSPKRMRKYWQQEAREAVTAQIAAYTMASVGYSEVIFTHPHSKEAVDFFEENMETLCLSTAPIAADWLIKYGWVDGNTDIVALDIGAAQACHNLVNILNYRTNLNIGLTVLKKDRPEAGKVTSQDIVLGNPQGKRTIVYDDVGASFQSMLTTGKGLHSYGSPETIVVLSHGVLSGEYMKNLAAIGDVGTIKALIYTNSLPQAAEKQHFLPISVEVIEIEEMLAFFAREVAFKSMQAVKEDPQLQDYILAPRNKHEVLEELMQLYT